MSDEPKKVEQFHEIVVRGFKGKLPVDLLLAAALKELDEKRHRLAFVEGQLERWDKGEYSHPKVRQKMEAMERRIKALEKELDEGS